VTSVPKQEDQTAIRATDETAALVKWLRAHQSDEGGLVGAALSDFLAQDFGYVEFPDFHVPDDATVHGYQTQYKGEWNSRTSKTVTVWFNTQQSSSDFENMLAASLTGQDGWEEPEISARMGPDADGGTIRLVEMDFTNWSDGHESLDFQINENGEGALLVEVRANGSAPDAIDAVEQIGRSYIQPVWPASDVVGWISSWITHGQSSANYRYVDIDESVQTISVMANLQIDGELTGEDLDRWAEDIGLVAGEIRGSDGWFGPEGLFVRGSAFSDQDNQSGVTIETYLDLAERPWG